MTGKEYAFDKGYTKQELEAAWENAKVMGNPIILNLSAHGHTWEKLNYRCVEDLMKKYAVTEKNDK